ncbi:MAG: O-antigen ligase family protein [Candidatus Omnitrophica bacterium]|nr:O-antigen ligase family protein [Candidatus Omnitrophota bacterium]
MPMSDVLLFLSLVTAPLLYGAVSFSSQIFLAVLSVIIFNSVYFSRPEALSKELRSPFAWLGLGMLVFILFQLAPLPVTLLKAISPSTYQFYAQYFPGGIGSIQAKTLSLYPSDTQRGLMQFMTYALMFLSVLMRLTLKEKEAEPVHPVSFRKSQYLKLGCLIGILSLLFHSIYDFNLHITANGIYFVVLLALAVGASRESYDHAFFRRAVSFIITFGFLIAVFAIAQKFSFNGRIYWVGIKALDPVGPYYNYDHYAGFMELCAAVAVSMVVASIFHTSFFHQKGLVKKVVWFSTREANNTLRYLFMATVMVSTIFLSSSRGGIMSFVLSQLVFFFIVVWAAWRARKGGRLAAAIVTMVLLITVMVMWLGPEVFLEKFHLLFVENIIKMEGPIGVRLLFYQQTLHVIKDFPMFGTGLNTFGTNFTRYRTFDYTDDYLRYTHNDYLQLVSETGVAGVIFLICFLGLFLFYAVRVIRKLE